MSAELIHTARSDNRTARRSAGERSLLVNWIVGTTFGETAGFAVAAAVGAALSVAAVGSAATYAFLVSAGAIEGALLGFGQSTALRRSGVDISRRAWVLRTSLAAAVAWSIGLLPSTLGPLEWTEPMVVGAVVLGAVALLASIPLAQLPLLRRVARPAWPWVPANVLAWSLGVAWTMLPSPFVDEGTPPPVILLVYVAAGLLMALTVAVITGYVLRSLLHSTVSPAAESRVRST